MRKYILSFVRVRWRWLEMRGFRKFQKVAFLFSLFLGVLVVQIPSKPCLPIPASAIQGPLESDIANKRIEAAEPEPQQSAGDDDERASPRPNAAQASRRGQRSAGT